MENAYYFVWINKHCCLQAVVTDYSSSLLQSKASCIVPAFLMLTRGAQVSYVKETQVLCSDSFILFYFCLQKGDA